MACRMKDAQADGSQGHVHAVLVPLSFVLSEKRRCIDLPA